MNRALKSQRGQVLALVAVGMVAMVAIVGLAIDAGNVFSDRRHAQNAADTSALGGALAKVMNNPDWRTVATTRANENGYTDVTVNNPPTAGCNGRVGPYAGDDQYVQVIIHSSVDTLFARVVGIFQLHNCVDAIAKAKPAVLKPFAYGNALAAMDCHSKWAFKAGGSSDTILFKGGIFVNSDNLAAIRINDVSNIEVPADKSITIVGEYAHADMPDPNPWDILTDQLDQQIPCTIPEEMWPQFNPATDCDYTVADFPDDYPGITTDPVTGVKTYELRPNPDPDPSKPLTYCITNSFKQPNYSLNGTNVHIVLLNPVGIHWNGSAEFHLAAGMNEDDPLRGIIIYLARPNDSAVILNGSADSSLIGTIFAPLSDITLNGDYGSSAFQAQIVGKNIDLSGSSNLTIEYDRGLNYNYTEPATISLSK
jgi:hypothetical protein